MLYNKLPDFIKEICLGLNSKKIYKHIFYSVDYNYKYVFSCFIFEKTYLVHCILCT